LDGQQTGDLRQIRIDKLNDLIKAGRDPYKISKYEVTSYSKDIKDNYEEMEGKFVSIAGRIMSKRGQGKVGFYDIQDHLGRIQMFAKLDTLGEEEYNWLKTYDIGDIIGVKGVVFKTKTGEISVKAEEVKLLSKSLQTLPEKFHGLKDIDIRYRQRYVDLIVNPEIKEVFLMRNKIIRGIREYLDGGSSDIQPLLPVHLRLPISLVSKLSLLALDCPNCPIHSPHDNQKPSSYRFNYELPRSFGDDLKIS
jgi:lysyl-tRNA synthetase class 2